MSANLGATVMGRIEFIGDPPYWLPVVQSGEAIAVDDTVQVTLRVSVPEKLPRPFAIQVQVPLGVAQHLRGQLQAVVPIAERNAKRMRGS
jgi:hypothetical protein